MMHYKLIRLYPTNVYCHLIIGENEKKASDLICKHLKVHEDYSEYLKTSGTFTLLIEEEGRVEKTILCYLKDLDPIEASHEFTHVAYHLAEVCGFQFTSESQELQAYYVSALMEEIEQIRRSIV